MGGEHQVLQRQRPGEAPFDEARHVGKEEHPARPSADRQHAGRGIALRRPGSGLGMENGKVHPIPAPATPPITGRAPRTDQLRPRKGRPGGGKASRVIPVPMGKQHPSSWLTPRARSAGFT